MIHYIILNHNHNKEAVRLAEYITENISTKYASTVTIYDNGSEYEPVFPNVVSSQVLQGGLWGYYNIRNLIDCPYVVFLRSGEDYSEHFFHDIEALALRAAQGGCLNYDPVALNFQGTVIYETSAFIKYTHNLYILISEFEKIVLNSMNEGLDGYILELIRYKSILEERGFMDNCDISLFSKTQYLKQWRSVVVKF